MSRFTVLCLSLLVPLGACSSPRPCVYASVTYQMLNRQLPPMAARVSLAGGRHECLPFAVGWKLRAATGKSDAMEMRDDDEMGGYGAAMLFRFTVWKSPGANPSFPGFDGSPRWRTARFCLPNGLRIIRETHTCDERIAEVSRQLRLMEGYGDLEAYHVSVRSEGYRLDGWLVGSWCDEPSKTNSRWPSQRLTALRLHGARFGGDRLGFKRFATLQILSHEPPGPT